MELENVVRSQLLFFTQQHCIEQKTIKNLLHEKFVDVFLFCFVVLKINTCVKNMSHIIIIVVVVVIIMFIV